MQAFGLSLIKGRLGSDQERREIQTSPERKHARGLVLGAAGRSKTSNAAAAAIEGVRPGSRPGPVRTDAYKELSHAGDNAVFRAGNARGASTGRRRASKKGAAGGYPHGPSISPGDDRRWAKPCKGWPSAPASGGYGLDKASPNDISRCPRNRRTGAALSQSPHSPPPGSRKKARRPIDKSPHTSPAMTDRAI